MKAWKLSSAILAVIVMATTGVARAADDLSMARALYASAAYKEALAALNRLRAAGAPAADAFDVEQYRAFCLLALGRGTEAQSSIEALVAVDPLYQPSSELSPRVRTAFSEVRRRLLPSIIPQQYSKAKAAFDKKDYVAAVTGFSLVLTLLADPEVVLLAGQPPLSDLRTLATGFQELSTKAIPPPPLPVSPPPAVTTLAAVPRAPAPPRVYSAVDANVVTPAVIQQELPPFTGRLFQPATGVLEIIINERGLVQSATMRESVIASYDRIAVDATRSWRYQPATLDGVPVKFLKRVSITVNATR